LAGLTVRLEYPKRMPVAWWVVEILAAGGTYKAEQCIAGFFEMRGSVGSKAAGSVRCFVGPHCLSHSPGSV
jgi:hypothetical protein